MSSTRNLTAFKSCPACGQAFGVKPDGGRPSLHLELGPGPVGQRQWRLSLFDDRRLPGRAWSSPTFHPSRVEAVYWLCADGHLFFDHHVLAGHSTSQAIDRHDRAAVVGGVAAGKSYLVLRTLNQHLTLPPAERRNNVRLMQRIRGDWVEERPLGVLNAEYQKAVEQHIPLNQTNIKAMMPVTFLTDNIDEKLVQTILRIHTELDPLNGEDLDWGNRVRQPIVQRYDTGGRRVFTSMADLPGEFFDDATNDAETRQRVLRGYSNLVWVVDPIVATEFRRFLPAEVRDSVTASSMRPDRGTQADLRAATIRREAQQRAIARRLMTDGELGGDVGGTQKMLICFTKADLVAHASRHGRLLSELGRSEAVVEGVANYLIEVANRSGRVRNDRIVDDLAWDSLIGELSGGGQESANRRVVALHLARAVVDHYSDGERLWNLVHDGGEDLIPVPAGKIDIEMSGKVPVPSLDQHVAASMTPGEAGLLRQRDLVMSALTCGLTYGIGLDAAVEGLLAQHWRDVRFFLCSPLGEVPVIRPGSDNQFQPIGGAEFPALDSRSAALVQLNLCLLSGVRP